MSTTHRFVKLALTPLRLLMAALLASQVAACATPAPADGGEHAFSELRLGRPAGAAPPPVAAAPRRLAAAPRSARAGAPALRPPLRAPADPSPLLPVGLAVASQRVQGFLSRDGFATETRSEGGGRLILATRMGAPSAVQGEAVCGLLAMRRPDIASTEMDVELTAVPGGVQVQVTAHFVEVDTNLISGDLARQACRSRGVLEAAVRTAAAAG